MASERWVALIGNPNTGKTTLFNALTGGKARTGNYPGVTVDKRVGKLLGSDDVRVLDLPGTYSLSARSPDEMVAVDVLLGHLSDVPRPAAVIVVADATNLERNLYLVTQVMEAGVPTVVALNMVDTAGRRGIGVEPAALAKALRVPVVPTVAHKADGVDLLRRALLDALGGEAPEPAWAWPGALLEAEAHLASSLRELGVDGLAPIERKRALLDHGGESERRIVLRGGTAAQEALADARAVLAKAGGSAAGLESAVRYTWIGGVVAGCLVRPKESVVTRSDRLDRVLTHRIFGTVILVVVLAAMFLSIFAWAAPLMDLIDSAFANLRGAISGWAWLGDGALKSLIVDGVIAGVGGVLIFLPQILILFGFVALLEGCGYMSRAALLSDRLMRWCGLSGRSIIPMLSSFACAVPGIMSARTIENRRDRLVTILVAPFMSCSARIPVYVILIAAFVPRTMVLGFLPLQGLVFAGMYLVGIIVAALTAFVLKTWFVKSERPSFLVELPPYRLPHLGVVWSRMWEQGKAFVLRAGTLIFAATILVWALSYFPEHPEPDATPSQSLQHSYLGRAGRFIEPVFEPIGWDWRVSVGVLAAFPAREVIVSTLGVIYNLGDDVDEESEGLRDRLRTATWDSGPKQGQPVLDLAGAVALMVFFALCAQCASTLAAIRKETGSWRWPAFSFVYMTVLAYVGALLVALFLRGVA